MECHRRYTSGLGGEAEVIGTIRGQHRRVRNVVSNSLMLAAVSTTVMSADTKIILYRTQASVLDNAQKNFARRR
eukprot:scaffold6511_cov164-Skeletonema_dohrnii-CCMP3373.AAC.7